MTTTATTPGIATDQSVALGGWAVRVLAAEEGLDAVEVFFGVDADGVEGSGLGVDVDSVFEKAELFEALGLFQGAGGQGGEALEGRFAICVEADVFPVLQR